MKIKAKLSPVELKLGLSLAIYHRISEMSKQMMCLIQPVLAALLFIDHSVPEM